MASDAGENNSPADIYEAIFVPAMFDPLASATLESAKPLRGERVLDLACGTGIVARRVAPLVGEGGKVVAVDLRPGMIAKARSLPPPVGAPIEWMQGDATSLEIADESFDLILCQQGIQFFSDRQAAANEMRRVMLQNGRVVLTVWRGLEHLTLFRDLTMVEARHLEKLGVTYQEIAAPFLMDDEDEIRNLLRVADFHDVHVSEATVMARFPSASSFVRDVELAYASVMPQFVEDPKAFEEFVRAVSRELEPVIQTYRDGNGVRFPLRTRLVVARGK